MRLDRHRVLPKILGAFWASHLWWVFFSWVAYPFRVQIFIRLPRNFKQLTRTQEEGNLFWERRWLWVGVSGPSPSASTRLLPAAARPCPALPEAAPAPQAAGSHSAGLGLGSSVCSSRDTQEHNESQDVKAAVLKVFGFKSLLCVLRFLRIPKAFVYVGTAMATHHVTE